MNNSNLTTSDRVFILRDLLLKDDPAVVPALQQLTQIAAGKGKEASEAQKVLSELDRLMGMQNNATAPIEFAKKGTTFKSNCNCPSRLAKQGGKLVIVDCHGQIIR